MSGNSPIKNYMDLAQEKCWDWKPETCWTSNEIEFIWFDRKGLTEFIKAIVENEKTKNEK